MSKLYSRRGDDGTTGLLGGGRVSKAHILPTTYGTIDEATSFLGLAKSTTKSDDIRSIVHQVQRDLYLVMAELAASQSPTHQVSGINADRVAWLEAAIEELGVQVELPDQFIVPGDTPTSAAFDVARTVVRRAERNIVLLIDEGQISNPHILPYLNRLSSLCFVMTLWSIQHEGLPGPSLSKGAEE
jgi:cob(I)alamin adenosyltransferase